MSTPKEKAKEIHRKMCNSFYHVANDLKYDIAKQCALIAVDEIIKALYDYGDESMDLQNMDGEFNFWNEVKTEIQNL